MAWVERLRAFARRVAPMPERIAIDDDGVTRDLGDGRREHVAWAALAEVVIVTTSEGPFVEDVWFLLGGEDGKGCTVGSEKASGTSLIDRRLRLDGFDHAAFIAAMTSTEDGRFVVWKRKTSGPPGAHHRASDDTSPSQRLTATDPVTAR